MWKKPGACKTRFLFLFGLVLLLLGIKESQSASLHKTTQQVVTAILGNDEISPKPRISIGHYSPEDKDPLKKVSLIKTTDKPKDKPKPDEGDDAIVDTLFRNVSTLSRREARLIIGALDRKTCFAKVLCGLGSKEPTTNTDLINDYAYLVGELVVNSEEDTKSTILGDFWDEFGALKEQQDLDYSSDEGDDDTRRRSDVVAPRKNYVPPFVPPFQRHFRIRRPPPPPLLFARFARQLSGGRQCRQLMERNACPYNDTQMGQIVTKLRQIIRGEDILGTFVKGASNFMSVGTGGGGAGQSSSSSPNRMNLIINIHNNLTQPAPQRQESAGFAAVPLKSFYQSRDTGSLLRSNDTLEDNNDTTTSSSSFNPFVLLPLVASTPPPSSSPPPPPPPLDPLQQLVGFLYSVGYAGNDTSPTTKVPVFPPRPTDEDDSEEEAKKILNRLTTQNNKKVVDKEDEDEVEDEESDEDKGRKSGIEISSPTEPDFIRIKSSQRTGRFHHPVGHGINHHHVAYVPVGPPPQTEVPILLRAFRFFSSIMRGGPIG
ncbi:hypothetical protein Fcan01_18329 [Folsomia candida]|uniref:Uncharacterized protein n=2 Tax=Folsomia candida TaxID=158441 RepID=A0A226DNB9_FOLCA|nr:hypothetical protein Fcan01_18329 [Folsomia candida]